MRDMSLDERLALGKLSELITPVCAFERSDLIWLSKILDIERSHPEIEWLLQEKRLGKESIFDFLEFVYTWCSDKYAKLTEEILRKFFFKAYEKLAPKGSLEERKSKLDIVGNTFVRYLEVLGYELSLDFHLATLDFPNVHVVEREISGERRDERKKLNNLLEAQFKDEYIAMRGAYERYLKGGEDASRQAIDSCRNAYENMFRKMTGKESWRESLREVIENRILVDLIGDVYSFLSSIAVHSPKVRGKEDALLAIRLTEEIMIRVFSEKRMW